jgi:hypothetical protein
MADPDLLTGGCLCGRTRYEARTAAREGYYCHCRMCQLAFGNTRAAFLNCAKAELRWTAEPPAYYASSKIARRGFCPRCGTPLAFEYHDSQRIDIAVGSLDEPARVKPTSHFAVESRIAAWHCDDGLPGEATIEHQRLMQRWREAYGEDVRPGLEAARGR